MEARPNKGSHLRQIVVQYVLSKDEKENLKYDAKKPEIQRP